MHSTQKKGAQSLPVWAGRLGRPIRYLASQHGALQPVYSRRELSTTINIAFSRRKHAARRSQMDIGVMVAVSHQARAVRIRTVANGSTTEIGSDPTGVRRGTCSSSPREERDRSWSVPEIAS